MLFIRGGLVIDLILWIHPKHVHI